MADFKLDRIRFNWKNSWTAATEYTKDDIVRYEGSTYVCVLGHTSSATTFYDDYGNWVQDLTVTVGRNTLDTANVYYINGQEAPELVLKRGLTYVFNLDDATNDTHQFLFSDVENGTHVNAGFTYNDGVEYYINKTQVTKSTYISQFTSATYREIRLTVADDNINLFYYCNAHEGMGNSIDLSTDAKWELQIPGVKWSGDWATGIYYEFGDTVNYSGIVYTCLYPHNSAGDASNGLEVDQHNWTALAKAIDYRLNWLVTTRYRVNDVVRFGGKLYRCIEGHTSAATQELGLTNDLSKWSLFFDGQEYLQSWTTGITYKINDLVKEGGSIWINTAFHTSTTFAADHTSGYWSLFLDGLEFDNQWSNITYYQIGDVVSYGGYNYRAKANNVDVKPQPTDTATWQQVTEAYKFRDDYGFDSALEYVVGDTVRHNGNLYTAIADNISIEPPSELHWKIVVPGTFWTGQWYADIEYKAGDLATYGSNTYKALRPHLGSTDKRPDTEVAGAGYYWELFAEGFSTNVLTTRGDLITYDNNPGKLNKQRFGKGGEGSILSSTGTELEWTAADYVAKVYYVSMDGTDGETNGTSLSSPFKTIKYAADFITANDATTTFNNIPYDIAGQPDQYVLQTAIMKITVGIDITSTAPNLHALLTSVNPNTGFQYGDVDGGGAIGASDAAIIYRYESQSSGNSKAENDAVKDIIDAIESDLTSYTGEYVVDDSVNHYVTYSTYPNTTIFVKTGIYSEILPISLPRNCALVGDELRSTIVQPAAGYEQSKMFYVNSACGIRNMSLQGLSDILGADNAYLTRRPTQDAAYVSLDPGTGPADSTKWIYKSPYIQNVSTFGTGCTGLKVDGDLHNGGYDSVVANDFTQVLSDGIGVWVTNLARSELVSVFTYYNHIGYLAEDGGKIRGTNGNNSYGKYGSVAEGVDTTETAISAQVNNRSTEAQIANVFTDGDNILTFEYSNAGESYTSATFGLTGTGTGAVVANSNVVNGGIFQIRLTGEGESPLGAGYVQLQGNAQDGPVDTLGNIKISAADSNTFDTYNGMRIVIISGAGAGQYGYITSYNLATKDCVIAKESDGTYGWDHMVPGTALEIPDSTSRYQIEPRVIVPAPASGTKAFIRLDISGGGLGEFKIVDPGSGYTVGVPPVISITDPNRTATGSWVVRVGNGVLTQPTWTNRGTGYVTALATASGDGYADEYQIGKDVHVTAMDNLPGPGANVQFAGNDIIYRLVDITNVTGTLGNQSATLTVSPLLVATNSPEHTDAVTIRESYSQVRLTGHDFLDIGSGNFVDTDYPTRYLEGYTSTNEPTQAYEAVDSGGGRVFYTSTDQDGNFRVGELFEVEQATGIITLNADAFELQGLEELRLGGVRLGGTSATVREFSTDATMSANSDEVVPTQKAVKAFIESRIGGGSANLTVNGLVAGQIQIQGSTISTETNRINFDSDVYFEEGVDGTYLQQALFLGNG